MSDNLTVKLITPGDGVNYPQVGQTVSLHYTGRLTNGTKFDSSIDRNKKFEFKVGGGQVIKGLDEGVTKMTKGERSYLTIKPEWAYGARGYPPVYNIYSYSRIPANSTLVFEVELIDFK